MVKNFISKIKKKKFSACIVGLGYVGLPLASRLQKINIKIYGIDVDKKKINSLKKGKNYIQSIDNSLPNYFKKNPENLSSNYKIIQKSDVIFICLPTPLKPNSKIPDMSFIFNCANNLKKYLRPYQAVILESTVFPGATNEFSQKLINKDTVIGKNLFLGYSPER